jgi:uncharacterized protein (DUF488 family)
VNLAVTPVPLGLLPGHMKLFTVGYGGRTPEELVRLLLQHAVRTVVDVRLRPDRASMGVWVKAKTPDKGIARVMNQAGIDYLSLVELGNVFLEFPDWQQRYAALLAQSGDLLVGRLNGIGDPICLLCAEKLVAACHRRQIAEFLARTRGAEVQHIE